jgi:predicted MFS family arabinose efflux permease
MMTSIVISGLGLGTMIMAPLASWLIYTYSWRISYMVIGLLALVVITSAAQFLRHNPSQKGLLPYGAGEVSQEGLVSKARGYSLREAIHTRQLWLLIAMFFCFGFSLQPIMVHIVPHATDLGISVTAAATILAFIGGGSTAGRLLMGSVADRIGNRLGLIIALSIRVIALSWLLAAREVWMFYLFGALFGLGWGSLAPLATLIPAGLFGTRSLGVIMAVQICGITLGSAIGPLLAGYIFDVTSSYNLAFIGFLGLSIVAVIIALFIRPIKGKEGNE